MKRQKVWKGGTLISNCKMGKIYYSNFLNSKLLSQ